MDIDYTVGEVELSYKPKFKNIYKVVSSEDAYKYMLSTYKKGTICSSIESVPCLQPIQRPASVKDTWADVNLNE